MKILLSLFFSLVFKLSYTQSSMTPKEAFFYGLSINGKNASDKLSYEGFLGTRGKTYQWGDLYASYFDKENYVRAVNDEFKRIPYLTQKFKELNEGTKNVDFSKTFYFTVRTEFGTYNTNCGCFPLNGKIFRDYHPVLLDIKEVGNDKLVFDKSFAGFSIRSYANFNDFDYVFKIKSSEAEKFIESKKDNLGNILRKITLRIYYNLTKKGDNGITAYLHKIEFYDGSNLLSVALPKFNYYDKVNLIRIKNGSEKFFLDDKWNFLNKEDSLKASYFRIVNYKDGKVYKVNDYFMSGAVQQDLEYKYSDDGSDQFGKSFWYLENGQKQSEGEYYNGKLSGQFRSWYSNGQKEMEANYMNGVLDGSYKIWYSNGYKKEEVKYLNGKKDGCDYNWDETGKCRRGSWAAWGEYADYYENGTNTVGESKCPCISSKQETPSLSNSNSNNAAQITIVDLAGTYNGISESAGSTITISSEARVIFKINGSSFTGTARTLNTKEKDHESVRRKIKAKLNKDVEVTGYDLVFAITTNGQTQDAHFALLKDEVSIILWGGGDAFFEKKK